MTVTVALMGDINLKQDLGFRPDRCLDLVADELRRADLRVCNLEGCLSDPGVELNYKPGWHHVEKDGGAVLEGLVDIVSCANNVHYGKAILESIAVLDGLGIQHTGAGPNRAAARRPAVVEVNGKRFGMLAFTSVFWPVGARATDSNPGVATLKAYTSYEPNFRVHDMPGGPAVTHTVADTAELDAVLADVRALKAEVDAVIVYFHWGYAEATVPADYQHAVGRAVLDAGADIVAGSSPHVPQGVERHGSGVILHSLGNFIFGSKGRRDATRTGLFARAEFDDDGLAAVSIVPVFRNETDQAELLDVTAGEGRDIAEFVVQASFEMGTVVSPEGTALSVKLR